jgi:predicted dehydrogenase
VNRPLRVALAGAGMVSRHHLVAWSRCGRANVVAIADPDTARAEVRAREFDIASVFADAAAMLDAVRPDALDIAAGHEAHGPLCALGASRGVAILCQKPLAPTLEAARAIARTVGDRVRLMVHENFRHQPWYRQAQRWVAQGEVGRVRRVSIVAHGSGLLASADGSRPALLRQLMLAGLPRLVVCEVLVHHLDVAAWLAGPLALRGAHMRHDVDAVRGESAATLLLATANGATVLVEGDMAVPGAPARIDDRMELVGTEATVVLEGATIALHRPHATPETVRFDPDEGYQASYDGAIAHFADALIDGAPFETPADVHLHVLALMEQAYALAGDDS